MLEPPRPTRRMLDLGWNDMSNATEDLNCGGYLFSFFLLTCPGSHFYQVTWYQVPGYFTWYLVFYNTNTCTRYHLHFTAGILYYMVVLWYGTRYGTVPSTSQVPGMVPGLSSKEEEEVICLLKL